MIHLPNNAQFIVETYPVTGYDLTTLRLWADGSQGHIELEHIRLTGVLGSSDGTLCQTGLVNREEIESIWNELERIGFWDMNPNSNTRSGSWWRIAASDGERTHSVERFGDDNEITEICVKCYELIDGDKLESGPFNVA